MIRDAAGLERLAARRTLLARLIAQSALAREESRGGHFRADFPFEDDALRGAHGRPAGPRSLEFERWS